MNLLLILLGKSIIFVSQFFNLGNGSTWPGHVALSINKNFIKEIIKANPQLKIILVAGTNGKTTTAKLIQTILEKAEYKVFQNETGANLLNGIASSLLLHSSILLIISYDYAIFEVDEATLPLTLKEITPDYLILLNLFRDQLDRYGEVNTIALKWRNAIRHLVPKTKLILNADDPQIASLGFQQTSNYLGADRKSPRGWNRSYTSVFYFGLNIKTLNLASHQHSVDSTYCPNCNAKLFYNTIYFSHLGNWECRSCKYKHPARVFSKSPFYPLSGTYNKYNTNAAVLLSKAIGIEEQVINSALRDFKPAFGRQEILDINEKKVQILLSKNPTSFNESLKTIRGLNAKNLLIALNDRIPDGRDISWIWDVDFEDSIGELKDIIISGDRAYDMGLRMKYTQPIIHNSLFIIQENLKEAIALGLKQTPKSETLYILPTYSAMLETRKILTGKKIL